MNELEELSIEVTNECSQSCIHCSSKSGERLRDELKLYEIKDLIEQAYSLRGTVLTLSGGEPLLRSDLFEVINYGKKKGFEVRLQTSGVYKEENRFRAISEYELKEFKEVTDSRDKIIYSVLGLEETHERITRVKNSYNHVLESIKRTKSEGVNTSVHTVVHGWNYDELSELKKVLQEYSVDAWHLLRLVNQGRCEEHEELMLNKKEFREVQEYFVKLKEEEGSMRVELGDNIDKRYWSDNNAGISECNIGRSKMLIRPNGGVTYCAALKYEEFGNIREDSLDYYWNEHEFVKKVRRFLKEDFENVKGKCKECNILPACKSGCTAQRLYAYDDLMTGPDPLCYRKD